jgi:hypothetical protein
MCGDGDHASITREVMRFCFCHPAPNEAMVQKKAGFTGFPEGHGPFTLLRVVAGWG